MTSVTAFPLNAELINYSAPEIQTFGGGGGGGGGVGVGSGAGLGAG